MIFLVTASTYAVTKPLIASQKEYTALKKKFNELIYDENIIQYLFQQELHLTDIDEVSKLSIGNTNAETCLTVVFSPICVSSLKNRHKAQRKAKFYINKCRSASCMQGGLKQASA